MPDLSLSIPHQLTRAEAKRRIDERFASMHSQKGMLANIEGTWTDDEMAFTASGMGQAVSGRLNVDDQAVHVSVALPWFLAMLVPTLKPMIEQQGRRLLTQSSGPARVT
jgi:hypothetical protein